LNAANEEAVHAFIEERIALPDIPRVIEQVMNDHAAVPATDLDAVLAADRTARVSAQSAIAQFAAEPRATNAA